MKIIQQAFTNMRNKVANKDYHVVLDHHNKLLYKLLDVMIEHGYVSKWNLEEYQTIKNQVRTRLHVHMLPKMTKCYSVSPQFIFKFKEIERVERRFLPSAYVGHLLVSTTQGIKTQVELRNDYKIGGKIIAYVY